MSRTGSFEPPVNRALTNALKLAVFAKSTSRLSRWAQDAGHDCRAFHTLESLQKVCRFVTFDAILLDVRESEAGYCLDRLEDTCHACNYEQTIVVVAPCRSEYCIVEALDAGAADFIAKPITRIEFLARLRTLKYKPVKSSTLQEYPPFRFDLAARQLFINDVHVELTTREFSLALYLFQNAGKTVLRKKILADIWDISSNIDTRRVDTYISRIRSKLNLTPKGAGWVINSIYQKGYILEKKSVPVTNGVSESLTRSYVDLEMA
ncbi:MAG TPA: hypothetical protein DD979_09420 [Gammaproteobacteria bacterium]|jgi:DNA-binding response OmpR family regulator|nr:hypothetical protein [Gammaproteobacteria bacterium]